MGKGQSLAPLVLPAGGCVRRPGLPPRPRSSRLEADAGADRTSAAKTCGMDRQTLRDWVHRYNAAGLTGLRNRKSSGRPPKLTAAQKAVYVELVEKKPYPARHKVVRWRCGLPASERRKLGAPKNWNCRDLKFFVGRVNFDQIGQERARRLNAVPTRFKLPAEDVDMLIAAGADSLRVNNVYTAFLASLR